jgi:formylglycine-generating enzyme required for sulfatase activity
MNSWRFCTGVMMIVTLSSLIVISGCRKSQSGVEKVTLQTGEIVEIEMVSLSGGKFLMGSERGIDLERPVHRVTVNPFAIGKYEVTRGQWRVVMAGSDPSNFKGDDDLPVENVSWEDIHSFLKRLGNGYRLPTEAEWEFAARGGTTTDFFHDEKLGKTGEYAWFIGNADERTHPVGKKLPNPFGIYDIYGNVWEWCEDDWHDSYVGAPDDGQAWIGEPRISRRVVRGASFRFDEISCRSTDRGRNESDFRSLDGGFRLAKTLP